MDIVIAPSHIKQYCKINKNDIVLKKLLDLYGDDCSYVYKIKCSCNCEKFFVLKDNHPSIYAKCSNCGKLIAIYELKYYPAATKLDKDYELKKKFENYVEIYVNYEYSDEFLYEDDVEFDENDISWGKVFVKNDSKLLKILDDETS